nr:hypothetical protein [Tanacetum cinerariifolium]
MAVLWNPIVRNSVCVVIPILSSPTEPTVAGVVGFGVCHDTSDPKIVKIDVIHKKGIVHWEVYVFTLSSRVWKSLSITPPFKLCRLAWFQDGGISSNLIISFDLESEEFGEVYLRRCLVHSDDLKMSKLNESLVVLDYYEESLWCLDYEFGVCVVLSADFAVTYTSVHYEARSWSIPSEDLYEEATQQLLEQVPRSPEYVPDPIELEDHVPLHIPEHLEDLVPAEDEAPIKAYIPEAASAPTPPLSPPFLSPRTPPLLSIPLHVPSTSRRAEIPEADMPPRKRLLLIAPRLGCEVGESSATAARQPGPTMARSKDHAAVKAEIEVLRRERLAYEQESIQTREALARSEAYSRELEARVAVLETQARRHEWQPCDALRSTNGDDSHNAGTGARRSERATRECTYTDFLKCQPLHFKGTEGVASLSQWFEIMESVFHISNCAVENQVKFATCTLHFVALTWWDTHVKTVGHDVAYGSEGLPDMIHGSVVASKPKRMPEAIAIATELMDQKIRTFAECEITSKRKFENTSRSTENHQQQPNKRQNTGQVYTAASGERKKYVGTLPLCNKCKFHHNGQCTIKNPTCYECGNQGHYRSDWPELKNQDHGNQAGGTGAHGMVHALEGGETNQDLNDAKDDINS